MKPTIRLATIMDLPIIRQMWHAAQVEHPQSYPADMTSPATLDEFTRQAATVLTQPNPVTFCLVAELGNEPIGFHCFGYQARDLGTPSRVVFTYWIYVVPAHRPTHVAEDLAAIAAEHALAQGITMAEMTRQPGESYRKGLGYEPFEVRYRAPLTTILTRLEERKRRRAQQATPVAIAHPPTEIGNGLDIPPPVTATLVEGEGDER